jgi:hypothetical protein
LSFEDDVCRFFLPSSEVNRVHTLWVNEQCRHRCMGVSGAALHNLHIGSCGQFRLARLLAVRILCWRIHAKIRHLGLAFAFQIGGRVGFLHRPKNCIR